MNTRMVYLGEMSAYRLSRYYIFVIAAHLLGWGAVFWISMRFPSIIGLGALAYGFGIRHALDADHITAIDNVTRKLLHEGENPLGVGFYFSLGHSSVVFAVAVVVGLVARDAITGAANHLSIVSRLGSFLGTGISGFCLLLIGLLNLVILVDLFRARRRVKPDYANMDSQTADSVEAGVRHRGENRGARGEGASSGGVMFRIFGRLFRFVHRGSQMYFVGFLFGLGFDTASEVALLAVSAGAAARGLSLLGILALPTLFAAGMVLMDTSDGALMAKAYGWSAANPLRRRAYNIVMTGVSVACALAIGIIEIARVVSSVAIGRAELGAPFNHIDSWTIGAACIGLFAFIWIAVALLSKRRRLSY